ncbi:hypothetical protein [Streptomyces rhizosphaericus]
MTTENIGLIHLAAIIPPGIDQGGVFHQIDQALGDRCPHLK